MNVCIITEENLDCFHHLLDQEFGAGLLSYGLIIQGVACGCAQVALAGQTAKLIHIFVAENFRRLGGGTHLIDAISQGLRRWGATSLSVAVAYLPFDDQSYVRYFFKHCNFVEAEPSSWQYSVPLEMSSQQYGKQPPAHVVPFSNMAQLPVFSKPDRILAQKLIAIQTHPDFCPSASVLSLSHGQIDGYLAAYHWEDRMEIVDLQHWGSNKQNIFHMVGAFAFWASSVAPLNTTVDLLVTNPKLVPLVERMLTTVPYSCCPVHQFSRRFSQEVHHV